MSGPAELAMIAVDRRLQHGTVTFGPTRHTTAGAQYFARWLMSEDNRQLWLERAEASVLEVVQVRSTNAYGTYTNLNFTRTGVGMLLATTHEDLTADLRRINSHICAIAYPILEEAGVLSNTRLKEPAPATLVASPPALPAPRRVVEEETAERWSESKPRIA